MGAHSSQRLKEELMCSPSKRIVQACVGNGGEFEPGKSCFHFHSRAAIMILY